jgi:hypothetical protein
MQAPRPTRACPLRQSLSNLTGGSAQKRLRLVKVQGWTWHFRDPLFFTRFFGPSTSIIEIHCRMFLDFIFQFLNIGRKHGSEIFFLSFHFPLNSFPQRVRQSAGHAST